MITRRLLLGLLLLLALASWSALAPGVPPRSSPAPVLAASAAAAADADPTNVVGAMSCSASACHGSLTPDRAASGALATRIRRDEYIQWHDRDPHASSLKTLQSPKSLEMLQRLQIIEQGDKQQWQVRAAAQAEYQNCLQCHALRPQAVRNPRDLTALEPVSCESCHGPAKTWLAAHYDESWPALQPKPKAFIDTADPQTLAQSCVKCHVGAADREVNHDMIAAGHPVLKFELAAYRALLPAHWNEARLRAQHAQYETDLWSAGQRQSALAALDVLATRYERSHHDLPAPTGQQELAPIWPEFAEFDCYACHRDLARPAWQADSKRSPKTLADWNPWYFAAWKTSQPESAITDLHTAMQNSLRRDDARLPQLFASARQAIAKRDAPLAPFDPAIAAQQWDTATQAYLQLVAQDEDYRHHLSQTSGKLSDADNAITTQLKELRALLAFVPGSDGPARPQEDAATTKVRREQIEELLRSLQSVLQQRGGTP